MCSKIVEALGNLGLLEKYQKKFEEEDVDDWMVEEWLQDSTLDELKQVIPTAGHRTRFIRTFQQLSSTNSKDIDREHEELKNSSPVQKPGNESTQTMPDNVKTSAKTDKTLEDPQSSGKNNNSSNIATLEQLPSSSFLFNVHKIAASDQPYPWITRTCKEIQEEAALQMLNIEFQTQMETLRCNKYFVFPSVQTQVEKIRVKLKGFFPTFFTIQNTTSKLETRFRKMSTILMKLQSQNKQRRLKVEDQMEKLFDSLCASEVQRLEEASQKIIPIPFPWTVDLDKLFSHFDAFLNGLVSPFSSVHDLHFQKECRDVCKQGIEELCAATNFSSSFVNEYSRLMEIELERTNSIYMEPDFSQLHEKSLSSALKSCNENLTTDLQKIKWGKLDDLTKSLILDYEEKFREENDRMEKFAEQTVQIKADDLKENKENEGQTEEEKNGETEEKRVFLETPIEVESSQQQGTQEEKQNVQEENGKLTTSSELKTLICDEISPKTMNSPKNTDLSSALFLPPLLNELAILTMSVSTPVVNCRDGDQTRDDNDHKSDAPPSKASVKVEDAKENDDNSKEFDKAKEELESLAVEVKVRLDNSPGTSSLVREPIEELLQEIDGVLNKLPRVELALLESYKKKLEIRAKRIK